MLISAALWLALGFPGLAALRRFAPRWLDGGVPSAIALSYLASFFILTPVALIGFALRLPIGLLSVASLLLMLAGAADLARTLPSLRTLATPSATKLVGALGILLLASDSLSGLLLGTHLEGDAGYHIARVRLLLKYGFNNFDPLVLGGIDNVYQANLYHALMAAFAKLAGIGASEIWAYSFFWAKLVCAAASGHLAWVLFGQRWIAWSATAFALVWNAPYTVLPFPNTLAPFWLIPVAAAFAVSCCTEKTDARTVIGLGATVITLAQVHPLYAVFAALMIVPALALRFVWSCVRGRGGKVALIAAGLALGPGLLWPLTTTLSKPQPPPLAAAVAHPSEDDAAEKRWAPPIESKGGGAQAVPRGFRTAWHGALIVDPKGFFFPTNTGFQLLAALLVCALTSLRRRSWPAVVMMTAIFAYMYLPGLCGLLIELFNAPWIVRRFSGVIIAVHKSVFPAALLAAIPASRMRGVIPRVACFLAVVGFAHVYGIDTTFWSRARLFEARRNYESLAFVLAKHRERSAFFDQHVRAASMVAAPLNKDYRLVMDCDCYPLATQPRRGHRGVADMSRRRQDTALLLNRAEALSTHLALLRYYGLRQVLVSPRDLKDWRQHYGPHLVKVASSGGDVLLELSWDPSAAPD